MDLNEKQIVYESSKLEVLISSNDSFWNLGLILIKGKTNYILSTADISTRLQKFALSLDDFGAMSDGTSINGAIAMEIGLNQQKCLAHGLQLAVSAVLYVTSSDQLVASSIDSESSDEDDFIQDLISV